MQTTLALIVAQVSEVVQALPGGPAAIVLAYGPLGASCWWLSREYGRLRRESAAALAARDVLIREVAEKNAKAMAAATHQISSLSRALVYNAATHGTGAVKAMAQREIDRWETRTNPGE